MFFNQQSQQFICMNEINKKLYWFKSLVKVLFKQQFIYNVAMY